MNAARYLHDNGDCWYGCVYCAAEDAREDYTLATCGGCGAYGRLGEAHYRKGEECGEFV